MSNRRSVATIETETALAHLNTNGGAGPLGNLNGAPAMTGLKSDLPFDEGGGYVETENDQLSALLTQVTGSENAQGTVSIWKRDERTSTMQYCGTSPADDLLSDSPLDFLARNFGAGEYELKIYTSDKKLFKRPRATISKLAEEFAKKKIPASTVPSSGGDVGALAQIMKDGFMQLGALIATRAQPVESRSQVIQEIIQMKQIFGGGSSGTDPMQMFAAMAGLFKSMQPRESSDNPFIELVDRFGPAIAEIMKNASGNQNQTAALAAPGAHAAPAKPIAPNQPAKPAITPEQRGAAEMSLQLKLQLGLLCTQASMDSDPDPWAAIIVEQVPREALEALLNDSNWLEALARHNDKVKNFPEWFTELRESVLDEMEEKYGEHSKQNLTDSGPDDIQGGNSDISGGDDVSSGNGGVD